MPAKSTLRSATVSSQQLMDLFRRLLALGRRVHDLGAAVSAVAPEEQLRGVLRVLEVRARHLAERLDDHVAGDGLFTVRRPDAQTADGWRLTAHAMLAPVGRRALAEDLQRRAMEAERAPVALGELVLVLEARHVRLAAAIDDGGRFGAEAFGLGDGVDRRVARADHHDTPPDRHLVVGPRLDPLDEGERVDHAGELLARDA